MCCLTGINKYTCKQGAKKVWAERGGGARGAAAESLATRLRNFQGDLLNDDLK